MSDDDLDKIQKKIFTWIILAMFGTIGVNQGIQSNFTVRADKFTGSDGRLLGKRIDRFEKRLDKVCDDITVIDRRVDQLEASNRVMKYQLEKGNSREHDKIEALRNCCSEVKRQMK